jgi:hypothetical protein
MNNSQSKKTNNHVSGRELTKVITSKNEPLRGTVGHKLSQNKTYRLKSPMMQSQRILPRHTSNNHKKVVKQNQVRTKISKTSARNIDEIFDNLNRHKSKQASVKKVVFILCVYL